MFSNGVLFRTPASFLTKVFNEFKHAPNVLDMFHLSRDNLIRERSETSGYICSTDSSSWLSRNVLNAQSEVSFWSLDLSNERSVDRKEGKKSNDLKASLL